MKKNLHYLFLVALLLIDTAVLRAQHVSLSEATTRAKNFRSSMVEYQTATRASQSQVVSNDVTLAYTAQQDTITCFYVFNYPAGGWVIIGGDEVCLEVLAYSEKGSFQADNMPDNVRNWLHGYEMEITACIDYVAKQEAQGIKVVRKGIRTASKGDKIDALIQTQWDQESPYWNMTPKVSGSRCLTGCVATAMAQVMYYYKWPKKGTGSKTYKDNYGCGQTLSTTFSDHEYGWDDMKLTTSAFTTTASKNAVAQLMYDCGVSVEMQYSTEGSGAYTEDIPGAMKNYFGYDTGIKYILKENYSSDPWASLLYAELAAGRPVLYAGADGQGQDAGGHQFICDGYEYKSSTDYFHFNFGWSGEYDGFYTLKTVGPTGAQFKYYQDAVIGVKPLKKEFYTVTLDDDSTKLTPVEAGGSITLPERTMQGFTFQGWSDKDIAEPVSTKPTTLLKGTYTPEANIKLYPVYSYTEEKGGTGPEKVLVEDFNSITDGDNTTTGGSGTAWNGNENFPSPIKVNKAGKAVRLGTNKGRGYLATCPLEIAVGSQVTVDFSVKGWSTVEGDIEVQFGKKSYTITYTQTMEGTFEDKEVTFTTETEDSVITICTTAKRAFIDNVTVTVSGPTKTTYYFTHHSIPTGVELNDEQSTSINTIPYSLSGQRVADTYRGIVIVNGKKYLRL